MQLNSRIQNRSPGKSSLAALVVGVLTTFGATATYAAVVCGTANLPASVLPFGQGIFINFVTGAVGTSALAVPGWDFNAVGTPDLSFVGSMSGANTSLLLGGGTAATTPSVLASGTTIGASGTYIAGTNTNPAWRGSVNGQYIGVRFINETPSPASPHYGWVRMTTTASTGFPATVLGYCWDNVFNTPITAGTTPVSLQNFSVD